MPRRRASKACLRCRQRKVRCDVTLRGVPCLNCQLDHEMCAIQQRKSKRGPGNAKQQSHLGFSDTVEGINQRPNALSGIDSLDQLSRQLDSFTPSHGHQAFRRDEPSIANFDSTQPKSTAAIVNVRLDGDQLGHSPSAISDIQLQLEPKSPGSGIVNSFMQAYPGTKPETEILGYSSHLLLPCIKDPELGHVSPLDIRFMQLNGCFSLPSMSILNEFVRMYFLHVHPYVPLLDEGDFWDSFSNTSGDKISLLVFQAMLFAACAFIPRAIAEATGFENPRTAATAFYKRAKILYDFEIESCQMSQAQTALLLTLWPGALRPGPAKSNTVWLSMAIRHAKSLRAHRLFSQDGTLNNRLPNKTTVVLRRIWWCCIMRDRNLALGLRRSLQIREKYAHLTLEDFENEIPRSRVYNIDAKQRLFDVFVYTSKLCVVLTDLLCLCSTSESDIDCEVNRTECLREVSRCEGLLEEWYDLATSRFPDRGERPEIQPHSVIVLTHLMYTYYFSAKLTLHHQEIFYNIRYPHAELNSYSPSTSRSSEVRATVNNIVKHLIEPVRLGLAEYMPVSAIAFAAMPLMIHIINAKIAFSGKITQKATANHQQLKALISLIKQCHHRLYGIDVVCLIIRRLTDLAQVRFMSEDSTKITDCMDLIDQKPVEYLRLFLNLGLSFSNATLLENYESFSLSEDVLRAKDQFSSMTSSMDSLLTPSTLEQPVRLPSHSLSPSSATEQPSVDYSTPSITENPPGTDLSFLDGFIVAENGEFVDPAATIHGPLDAVNETMDWEMDAWLSSSV